MSTARDTIGDKLVMAFATPLLVHDIEGSAAMNAGLVALIERLMAETEGVKRSNVGGWHSDLDFLTLPDEPAVQQLRSAIQETFSAIIPQVLNRPVGGRLSIGMEGWANALRAGQYNALHSHPNAAWSGAYFPMALPEGADPDDTGFAGKLEFIDPRPSASAAHVDASAMTSRCLVTPAPGRMALFPGWLQHVVHPFSGEGRRYSIAFNIFLREG